MKSRLLKVCSWVLVMVMLINLIPAQVIALETQQNDSVVTTDDTQSMETATESTEDASILMEIEEKRTEFSKEYKLSNGLNMLIVYPEAVHYEKNGKWEDIDSTLKITTDGHYATTEGA